MGQKSATQSGIVYRLPVLPEEHKHLLNELPSKYIQMELFPRMGPVKQKRSELYRSENSGEVSKEYFKGDLESLEFTEYFEANLIKHIFEGEVKLASAGKGKRRMEATGFHSEVVKNVEGKVIPGTCSAPNVQGVYEGKVTVKGIRKRVQNGFSTFFPRHWSPQQVVNAINQAYENRRWIGGTLYSGNSGGIEIVMRLK